MTVSISNMTVIWANTEVYTGIGMNATTNGQAFTDETSFLKYSKDNVLKYRVDHEGIIHAHSLYANNGKVIANTVRTIPLSINSLPNANTIGLGTRAFVTDANTIAFMGRAYANGNNAVPVFSNGKYWLIG